MKKGDFMVIVITVCCLLLATAYLYDDLRKLEKEANKLQLRIEVIESILKEDKKDIQQAYFECVDRSGSRGGVGTTIS